MKLELLNAQDAVNQADMLIGNFEEKDVQAMACTEKNMLGDQATVQDMVRYNRLLCMICHVIDLKRKAISGLTTRTYEETDTIDFHCFIIDLFFALKHSYMYDNFMVDIVKLKFHFDEQLAKASCVNN